jgi:hypothetical protein
MTLKFLALQGTPYIYDISRLRVKTFDRSINISLQQTPTEKGIWVGNPVDTHVEGCSCKETLLYERTKSKAIQKTY